MVFKQKDFMFPTRLSYPLIYMVSDAPILLWLKKTLTHFWAIREIELKVMDIK